MRCPHENVADCPLYLAAHFGGFGCDDGHLDTQKCAVARGKLNYALALAAFREAHPRQVAMQEWNAAKRERAEQIERNIRLNGIH